jgi:acetyl esterase/lipase
MSLRLRILSALLRTFQKPQLARVREPRVARARFETGARLLLRPPRGVAFTCETGAGRPSMLWAQPPGADARRVVLYLHGGAFLMGSPHTHRRIAARLGALAGACAALPAYRLAPENAFPADVDDVLASYRALLDRGLDPRAISVAGESAGGGLVFALLAAARAAGLPDPACLVAFSPWADMTGTAGSLRRNAGIDAMLPVARMPEVVAWRLRDADPRDPRASPVLARFDAPPPPTLIQASRAEILEDDASAMAATLRAAGGEVRLEFSPDAPHAWQLFDGYIPEGRRSVEEAGAFIVAHLSARP